MKPYIVSKRITVGDGVQLYLLKISDNIRYCNSAIIPKNQLDEIKKYKIKMDVEKRLLARSFLYSYLFEYHDVYNFELGYNEYEKPFLKAAPAIHFSFSYAKDYLLVGISTGKQLGVDIEYIDPSLEMSEIAPEIMCPAELQQFNSCAGNPLQQSIYFFNLFSAKESVIKSFATGLYFDVKKINTVNNKEYSYRDVEFIYHELGLWMNQYTLALCCEK